MQHTRSQQTGFTILEIVVAFSIMASAGVALIGARTQSLQSFQKLQDSLAASMIAEDYMERLLMNSENIEQSDENSLALVTAYEGEFRVDYSAENIPLADLIPFSIVLPTGYQMMLITVLVEWEGNDGRRQVINLERLMLADEAAAARF